MQNRRSAPPDHSRVDSVYWMESSPRRQALEWLRREDLSAEERGTLDDFVARYRTTPGLPAADRRALLGAFDRIGRRLRSLGTPPARPGP